MYLSVFSAFSSLSCKILAQNHFDNIHGHNNSKNLRTIPICMWNGFYFLSLPSFPSVIILLHGKKYSMSAFLSRPGECKPSQFHNEWMEIRKLEGNEMDKCTHANKWQAKGCSYLIDWDRGWTGTKPENETRWLSAMETEWYFNNGSLLKFFCSSSRNTRGEMSHSSVGLGQHEFLPSFP